MFSACHEVLFTRGYPMLYRYIKHFDVSYISKAFCPPYVSKAFFPPYVSKAFCPALARKRIPVFFVRIYTERKAPCIKYRDRIDYDKYFFLYRYRVALDSDIDIRYPKLSYDIPGTWCWFYGAFVMPLYQRSRLLRVLNDAPGPRTPKD